MYDITSKFAKNSPLPCWKGYSRVPGTTQGAKGSCKKSPAKKATTKVCLPKAKIASMSTAAKNKVMNAKKAAAAKGETRRASSSNVKGTDSDGSLITWIKQDWRQVGNPSKKCGEA